MTQSSQPVFLIPEEPGRLSNWSTGIGTADNISFTVRYSNPGEPSEGAGQMRATATRTATSGFSGKSALAPVWDSAWVGSATSGLYPSFNGVNSFGMAYSSNRIYITGGSNSTDGVLNTVWSAPFNGGSIGTFRAETPLPVYTRMHCCVAIGAFLHVISGQQTPYARYASTNVADVSPHCWVAPILGDGVIGGWTLQKLDLTAARVYAHAIQAGNYNNPAAADWGLPILMVSGGADTDGGGTASAATYATTVNTDGSFEGWVTESSMLAARYGHFSLYDDSSGKMWVFGGTTGGAALNTIEVVTWSTATRTMGIWANNGTLPAVRAGMAGVYVPGWDNTKKGRIALFGGTQAATLPATTSLSNTIIYGAVPPVTTVSWNVSSQTLPTAANCLGAASVLEATAGGYSNGQWQVAVAGGKIATGFSLVPVISYAAAPPNTATDFNAPVTGIGAALTGAALGVGGGLVTQTSGDQDWTFNYGLSTGQAPIVASLSAGDEIEVAVQFTNYNTGDPSPIAYTSFVIGPAPYITAAAPSGTITTGQPTASFTYNNPSVYSKLKQATWRLQVTGPSYPSLVLLHGASMYLRLNGTSTQYDSSDTHTGTITGGVTTGVAGGLTNDSDKAVTFDGTSGYITCASTGNWANGSWSLEFLVKTSTTKSLPCYFAGSNTTLGNMVGVYVADSSTNNAVRLVANNISVISYGTAASIADGKWHHVAITHTTGVDFRLYLDGSLVSTSTNTQDWNLTHTTLGARINTSSVATDFANGSMDEAALYIGTVLSPSSIQAHYTAMSNGPPVYFDSGIRPDLTNSVQVNTAPLLQSGTNYAFNWTVTTNLDPIDSRSSTSATQTTTVTPSYTIPAAPT